MRRTPALALVLLLGFGRFELEAAKAADAAAGPEHATAPAEARLQSPVPLFGATQFDLASKISARTYRIFVYKPITPGSAAHWNSRSNPNGPWPS
ncbi:MAG TPA: hypothetical protein VK652_19905 [Steroidobacteraceae bacterium]|nr:hypothetical protein [Steroidobacteraceae bacterium]